MSPEYFDNNGAADYIGASPSTLPKWRLEGSGPPFVKVGRKVIYRKADIDAWLAHRTRTSTSDPGRRAA